MMAASRLSGLSARMKPILLKARSHMYRHWRKRCSGNVWATLSELALAKPRLFRFNDHTFQRRQSAAAPGYAGRPVLRCARQALSDGQSRPPSRKKVYPGGRTREGTQRGPVRQASLRPGRGSGGPLCCRYRQARTGRARCGMVDGRSARLQQAQGDEHPLCKMVFRLEGRTTARGMSLKANGPFSQARLRSRPVEQGPGYDGNVKSLVGGDGMALITVRPTKLDDS